MSFTIAERPDSRQLSTNGAQLTYVLIASGGDIGDSDGAETLLLSTSPTSYNSFVRKTWNVATKDGVIFDGEVQYGAWGASREEPEPGVTEQYSFDISGLGVHVTEAIATTKYGTSPPDFGNAINVVDGEVQGIDLEAGVFKFTETRWKLVSALTPTYLGTVYGLYYKVNNGSFATSFGTFAQGELRFVGCSGSWRSDDTHAEIVYHFEALPNETGLTIGSISSISKKGWDYLWVLYEQDTDGTAKFLVQKPRAVYVQQVYKQGDFSGLGL